MKLSEEKSVKPLVRIQNNMKDTQKIKDKKIFRRKVRVRAKIFGTAKRPRLSVFRSLKHIYVQFIDDEKGVTVAAASDHEIKKKTGKKTQIATEVGQLAGEKAVKAGVKEIVFDRSSSKYHGRVKAVAEGVRKSGIKF